MDDRQERDIAFDAFNKMQPFAKRAYQQFDDVLDYIWKSPRLIESEKKVETRKRRKYFPLKGDLEADAAALSWRAFRKAIHDIRFEFVYPHMIASGNLFAALSLYEFFVFALCKEFDGEADRLTTTRQFRGIHGLRRFLEMEGVNFELVPYDNQILAAISIRNCLVHANGILSWSSNETKLREIIDRLDFLSPYNLMRLRELNRDCDDVVIEKTEFGDRIRINNDYAYKVAAMARDHFCHMHLLTVGEVASENGGKEIP